MKVKSFENVLVSIIIPCYNAQNYLEECLDSIIDQSFKNFEVIAINDGSSDKTLEILKKYSIKDERVKFFDQDNSGVSYTRNRGINLASGNYIMFVDADDFIGKHYLKEMVEYLLKNQYDFVTSGMTFCNSDGRKKREVSYSKASQELIFKEIITSIINNIYFSVCYKTLIKKKLLVDNSVFFETNIRFGEDLKFTVSLFETASKIGFLSNSEYFYRLNEGSATSSTSVESALKYMDDNLYIFTYLSRYTDSDYLIPNRLLSKMNISMKKVTLSTQSFKDFKTLISKFEERYPNILNNKSIKISKLYYENILDKTLIYLLYKKKYKPYYLINKLYFFLKEKVV
ncbi:glycosyltransferase family 2 protein [Streptococcus sp. FT1-106]|uniref:glycosyltransferase family 2 protein n=1 Tax=Streptococcus sp. FT1-106 TaxID=3409994 RepID=UPI003BF466A6